MPGLFVIWIADEPVMCCTDLLWSEQQVSCIRYCIKLLPVYQNAADPSFHIIENIPGHV